MCLLFSFFEMFYGTPVEWTRGYPAHFNAPAITLCQHFSITISAVTRSDPPTWQMLYTPLLFALINPRFVLSAYKKPLFACTKAILCNIQHTTVWAIVSAWFIISICVYIKASWNSQTSTSLVSTWKGLDDSMYDIHNVTEFISSSNGELIEKQHFLCNYPFSSAKHWLEKQFIKNSLCNGKVVSSLLSSQRGMFFMFVLHIQRQRWWAVVELSCSCCSVVPDEFWFAAIAFWALLFLHVSLQVTFYGVFENQITQFT